MKFRFKRYDVVPILLFIYLGVMVCLGYPGYVTGTTSPMLYFGGTAITVVVIILLRYNLKKRTQYRRERQKEIENSIHKETHSEERNKGSEI